MALGMNRTVPCGGAAQAAARLSSRVSRAGGAVRVSFPGSGAARAAPVARRGLTVAASGTPPDTPWEATVHKGGREWLQTILARFGPVTERAPNTAVLDFEKPLVELDNRIREVRQVAEENGVDVSAQIKELEDRAVKLRTDTYNRLTPTQKLQVARHPNRPTCLDIVLNITDKFVELHGDRAGLDDPALICGIGTIDGVTMMFMGHQKGRNTKENIERNFGMPQPNGYRKALRFMRHADKFGLPIVTFVDTPGAYAGINAEELGQGEAIAVNLREMFGFRVPIFTMVIGEGGSGGALAIACGNKVLIWEHAVYYVASPEACAAILWKSREKAPIATEMLRITGDNLTRLGVVDEIIPEPLGGAHADPMSAFPVVKETILKYFNTYKDMPAEQVKLDRYARFRNLGMYQEFLVKGGMWEDALAEREASEGVTTSAGTWAASKEEADYIETAAELNEKWEASLKTPEVAQWIWKPKRDEAQAKAYKEEAYKEILANEAERKTEKPSGNHTTPSPTEAA